MAARAGAAAAAGRSGARKWLASLFGDAEASASSAKTSSKSVAKERLQIILAHQRGSQVLAGVDLQALQKELLECVQRHIQVANGANINIAGTVAIAIAVATAFSLSLSGKEVNKVDGQQALTRVSCLASVKSEGQLDIFEMQVPVDGGNPAVTARTRGPAP